MSKSQDNRPPMHTEPPAVRRKLAERYEQMAKDKRFTKTERAEFARMARNWRATLAEK